MVRLSLLFTIYTENYVDIGSKCAISVRCNKNLRKIKHFLKIVHICVCKIAVII